MDTMTWLHISNLQFNTSQVYDTDIVLEAFLRDVVKCTERYSLHPDFIFVTGDIASSGNTTDYDLARQFFDDLLEITHLDKARLFLVPGNHDVNRAQVSPGARTIGASLTDRILVNAVLASSGDRELMFARFAGYADFVNDYLGKHLPFDQEHYFYTQRLEWAGKQIALLGLNSAWLSASDHDEKEGLVIGEHQVRLALDKAASADLKIALLHHPFDRLRKFDRDDVEAMLCGDCDFVLQGHAGQTKVLGLSGPDSKAMVIAAGGHHAGWHPSSYNYVHLDLAAGAGTVHLRRYSPERGGFWSRDTATYQDVSTGRYRFRFAIKKPETEARVLQPEELADASMGATPDLLNTAVGTDEAVEHLADWRAGHVLDGKYEILERIAATEHCRIYLARELHYTREMVAIKHLKPDILLRQQGVDPEEAHERFEREIAILRHIDHQHVLRLLDDGGKIEHGDRYLVTQFADRGSLEDYLRTKPARRLELSEALQIAKAICQAVDSIHHIGIVHRDIKPSNIFLFSKPTGYTVKLADFGISRVPETWLGDDTITQPDVFLGSYLYSAPEQFSSELNDPRSDLYALAAVFFEMLTGQPLGQILTGKDSNVSFEALLYYHYTSRNTELPASLLLDRGVPPQLVPILQKALRRDPESRYRSAEELQTDLMHAEMLLANSGASTEERYLLGIKCWKHGDLQDAVEQLKKIPREAKHFSKAQSALAAIYDELGDRYFAKLRFIAAIKHWFESHRIQRTQMRLS
jgi:serine/threonine protein kinase